MSELPALRRGRRDFFVVLADRWADGSLRVEVRMVLYTHGHVGRELRIAKRNIEQMVDHGRKYMSVGELEKPPWMREALRLASMELHPFTSMDTLHIRRVHYMTEEQCMRRFNEVPVRYFNLMRSIVVPKSDPARDFDHLMHELAHAYSFHAWHCYPWKGRLRVDNRRLGYHCRAYPTRRKGPRTLFVGFNESVTSFIEWQLVYKLLPRIAPLLGMSVSAFHRNGFGYYKPEMDLLQQIFTEIVRHKGRGYAVDFEQRIMRGLFTGNMMHLRRFEEIFGPGSVRLIAEWKTEKD